MPQDPRSPITVAVTGAGGYIAARLIRRLAAEERIERIVGLDVRPPALSHSKLVFDVLDVRNPALRARLSGVDVLVHLAFSMDPRRDEAELRDVNVNGSQNAFRCAGAAGVRKLVYTSSAAVYGAHPDNDVPLTEESPLRANLDFPYAAHKLEVEYVVGELAHDFPGLSATVFRPAIVFGPHTDNMWSHLLEAPVIVGVEGHRPPFQFVHEDDVAAALQLAVLTDLPGVYNLVPEGWLEYEDALAIAGRRRVEMSEPAAWSLLDRLRRWGLFEAPPGILHYLMHPWVMTSDGLAAAGFVCRHSNAEALADAAERARERIRVGRLRMRRDGLAHGAAAGLGALGAAAIWMARRRPAAS